MSFKEREKILTSSYAYFITDFIWLVPPGKPHTAFQKLLNPLENSIWILFGITIAIGFLVIAMLKKTTKRVQDFVFGNKIQSPAMNIINISLGNSLHELPLRNFSRFLFLIFTLYCFILRSGYLCSLVKFMQMDTRDPIMQGTKDLIDNNFNLYFEDSSYLSELALGSHGRVVSYEKMVKIRMKLSNPNFKGAVLSTKSNLAYFNKINYPKFTHHAPEYVFSNTYVIYMQRHSCLKK